MILIFVVWKSLLKFGKWSVFNNKMRAGSASPKIHGLMFFFAKPKHLSTSLQLQSDPFVICEKVLMRSSDVILVVWYTTASYEDR